ncbi:hypothetical protein BS47DRAFT_220304 [Hydnum rufescens UP504]|uniref:Protein kinase domain-containing protein n=1 Tax=Hydnum rufescens UP504 TaxID=1448309 RepID=A0A9P6AMJ2_9AGAM|nr:hypothetical protein BS47DRAFT_220304 [Hydnum rufescens UP504]
MSLTEVVEVLAGIFTALEFLRCAGWVHRDVSLGNILSCNSTAKLAEYARKIGDTTSQDIGMGTNAFMSIEVSWASTYLGLQQGLLYCIMR